MRNRIILAVLCVITTLVACQQADYMPKPRGYHRIDFPQKGYHIYDDIGCPFRFEIPSYSHIQVDPSRNAQPCWRNLDFPEFNARLHLSYSKIDMAVRLDELSEDARTFVFKHTAKATGIDQKDIVMPEYNVYGMEYSIKGNTASNYQFYVSDSTDHYLRGALYFNEKPNLDSIQPVLDFLTVDIQHLIRTIRWK